MSTAQFIYSLILPAITHTHKKKSETIIGSELGILEPQEKHNELKVLNENM